MQELTDKGSLRRCQCCQKTMYVKSVKLVTLDDTEGPLVWDTRLFTVKEAAGGACYKV